MSFSPQQPFHRSWRDSDVIDWSADGKLLFFQPIYHSGHDSDGTYGSTACEFLSPPAHPSSVVRNSDGTGGSTAGEFLSPPAHPSSVVRDSDDPGGSTGSEFLFPPIHAMFTA